METLDLGASILGFSLKVLVGQNDSNVLFHSSAIGEFQNDKTVNCIVVLVLRATGGLTGHKLQIIFTLSSPSVAFKTVTDAGPFHRLSTVGSGTPGHRILGHKSFGSKQTEKVEPWWLAVA